MTEDPTWSPEPKATFDPSSHFKHQCANDQGEYAYNGILNLLPFMRQDSDNVVFRRFQNLHLVYLLALQHQLKHCVEQLHEYNETGYRETLFKVLDTVGPLLKR